jgi:hypothetical protein
MDIVQATWFSQILDYSGGSFHLAGFEQGINLIVETPFVIAAFVVVLLNSILPKDQSAMPRGGIKLTTTNIPLSEK